MTLSMHQACVPVLSRGLRVLATLLRKGEDHAAAQGLDPADLVGARLAPDMLPLAGQVQRASDSAKLAAARLSGIEAPSFPDEERTFDELQARIARTLAFLEGIGPEHLAGSEARSVVLRAGGAEQVFRGDAYLLGFALPNFFFHVATAYDILRQAGVAIGKRDYLGPFDPA
ncbi:hypothetical protein OPKNFCMD_6416 [Methylobacterium crusticola]|uniref:DUF1993 domain-containing protein n=1 Tax=Methylobacterium crusticola TaxID=1697972 RepID=A0ABQ4R8V0_9HYPH|nr:DUF1993 domain-containing protein [Methylobacterium crusticola]GJD53639.1 hypothetical protein OPKNFCMD_6416 [Methylobacterium crusticola]